MRSIILFIFGAFAITGTAQSAFVGYMSKANNDSIECLQKISVYREFKKMKLRENAVTEWEKVYQKCPGIKKIIYQDGARFLKHDIVQAKNESSKKQLIDSLMRLYDKRIKYFGEKAYVYGRKGFDLYHFDKNRTAEARDLMYFSAKQQKEKTQLSVLNALMSASMDLNQQKQLNTQQLINTYLLCNNILEQKLKIINNPKKESNIRYIQKSIKKTFAQSTAAQCNQLTLVLSSKFQNNPQNIDSLTDIVTVFIAANRVQSDLFYQVASQIDRSQPNAQTAYLLAGIEIRKNNYPKASEYFQKAINLEKSKTQKALYYRDFAIMQYARLNNFENAQKSFENSLAIVNSGKTYYAMAEMYAAYHHNFNKKDLEYNAFLWLAVDYYLKAKTINPKLTKKANEKIAYYRQFFPTNEDVFFFGLKPGQSYTIGDWINKTTTVRVK